MNYDECKWCEGKDGKEYWVGSKKIIPPMSASEANYETKYREFSQGDIPQEIPWEYSSWERIGHHKADNSTDAILQGMADLKQQGILPLH